MKLKVYSQDGKEKGTVELSKDLFGGKVNTVLLHDVVTAYAANQRQGTAKSKGRAEVSGGGHKPFRQKGTGNARAGSNTSPVWVRGGKAFGPDPRSYYTRIPQKVRTLALRHALSSRVQDSRVLVVDGIACEPLKTKTVVQMLGALSLGVGRSLIVTDGVDQALYRCGRNIRNLSIIPLSALNAAVVLRNDNIILKTKEIVSKLESAVAL
jgi:large subunit ribosomal protein L4